MENQLNEAAGIDTQASKTNKKEEEEEDALNDAWNDDFDDDAIAEDLEEPESAANDDPPTTTVAQENGGEGWDDQIIFDDSLQDVVPERTLPPPIGSDSLVSQLDQYPPELGSNEFVETPQTHMHDPFVPSAECTLETQPDVGGENHEASVLIEKETSPLPQKEEAAVTPEIEWNNGMATESELPQQVELPSEDNSPVIVVQPAAAAWEEDLYDDDDDDDDDEECEEDNQPPDCVKADAAVAPPTTISIPSPKNGGEMVDAPPTVAIAELENLRKCHAMELTQLRSQMQEVLGKLQAREDQVVRKSEQMASMMASHEAEKDELRNKIKETKEEAKRRITKAKERVEALERSSIKNAVSADDATAKDETINALREEGQKLAKKQSEMEKAVRSALAESRELAAQLEEEQTKKDKALDKAASLETEMKKIKDDLNAARRGESQASKLENELQSLKEDADRKDAANLLLQQQIKELKAENKELRQGMESVQKGALVEAKRESNKLKKEHSDLLAEMEVKLRASERDASVREDALRTEVTELRKRWQDAVRRADALSMDVQSSTAPLLRQLESIERQNRVRAAAWAELETKLRTDLENLVIDNENLTKERNEYKSSSNRLSRVSKERDDELSACKNMIEDQKIKISKHEALIEKMETEGRKMKEEWSEVERLANEGVSKVRSDMMTTVLESEERHQAQLKSIENELKEERKKRNLLEHQVNEMLENAGMVVVPTPSTNAPNASVVPRSVEKKLRSAESQGSILTDVISGLDGNNGAEDDVQVGDEFDDVEVDVQHQAGTNSFAAMEQLSQRLKESKVELDALRQSLASSERIRASLLEELGSARVAKEKLPLFEAKVQELALENREKEMEIAALKEDVAEIRQLYRGQLNMLLEEKAATLSEESSRTQSYAGGDVFMTPHQSPPPSVLLDDSQPTFNGKLFSPTSSLSETTSVAPRESSKID